MLKYITMLALCVSLSACALTPAPESIKQGTALASRLAAINQNNIKAINEQYHAGFKEVISKILKREEGKQTPDQEIIDKCKEYLIAIDQLYSRLQETTYPVTDFQVELTQALAAWAAEPGIELTRLAQIIINGASLLPQ